MWIILSYFLQYFTKIKVNTFYECYFGPFFKSIGETKTWSCTFSVKSFIYHHTRGIVKWLFEIRDRLNQTHCGLEKKPPLPPPLPPILHKEEKKEEGKKRKKKQTDKITLTTDKKQSTGELNIHESYNSRSPSFDGLLTTGKSALEKSTGDPWILQQGKVPWGRGWSYKGFKRTLLTISTALSGPGVARAHFLNSGCLPITKTVAKWRLRFSPPFTACATDKTGLNHASDAGYPFKANF